MVKFNLRFFFYLILHNEMSMLHGKDFADVSKNLIRYGFKNYFVGSLKLCRMPLQLVVRMLKLFAALFIIKIPI